MTLKVSFVHLPATPALETYAKEKLNKITSHFDLIEAHVRLKKDQEIYEAAVEIKQKGKTSRWAKQSSDMYAAIDALQDLVHEKMQTMKERNLSHRRMH